MIHFLGLKGMPRWSAGPSSCGHCQESKGCHTGSIGGDDAVWPGDLHVNDAFGTYNFFFHWGAPPLFQKGTKKQSAIFFLQKASLPTLLGGSAALGGVKKTSKHFRSLRCRVTLLIPLGGGRGSSNQKTSQSPWKTNQSPRGVGQLNKCMVRCGERRRCGA